jgi:hypothetical protein
MRIRKKFPSFVGSGSEPIHFPDPDKAVSFSDPDPPLFLKTIY